MSLPFYLGQSVDEVLKIAKVTGRQRRKMEIVSKEGTFTLEYDEGVARDRDTVSLAFAAINTVTDALIDVGQDLTVRYFYDDCILTFQRTYDDEGGGALCYRVTGIEETDV
jgi:hypothetical protein